MIKDLVDKINKGEVCLGDLFDHGYVISDIKTYRDGVEVEKQVIDSNATEVTFTFTDFKADS